MKQRCSLRPIAIALIAISFGGIARGMDGHGDDDCLTGKHALAEWRQHEAGAFDEATGRDLRNFPPDRVVDFQHMKLQMRFDNLNDQKFTAFETLTVTPIGRDTVSLMLDAVGLKIVSVKRGDKPVEFAADDSHVTLRFDPALPVGVKQDVVIEYVCDHPVDGMIFTPYSPDAPHYTAEVHTQGEPNTNRYWFICHDFPNERMSTELIVDVPAGYSVSSNGKLVSNLNSGDRAVWHYRQEKPHVAYLVSLIIGKFDIVEIPHPRVPLKVWVPQGLADQVMQTYGRTGEMIDLFESKFGVPYPWDRYDQLCVKNFHAGGMENTSATTMYPTAVLDKTALLDGDLDGLISHELCHQWTGDYITCKSWAHIWLNEGWATYGSALWNERRYGQDGYLDSIRGSFRVADRDKTTNELPMVSPIYDDPDETFRRPANPYPKGSSILHMLRMMLGDDLFWKGTQLYMSRYGLDVAETDDFRRAMEEVSGLSLEWFFDQWFYRPGTPQLSVKVRYDGEGRALNVEVEQTQQIDARTPAFRFTLPVFARTASGDQTFNIEVTEKSTSFRTVLDGPPTMVAIDPNLFVLKMITEEKPLAMWVEQAKGGPTIAARHAAVEALGKTDSPDTIALLSQIIRDEQQRYTLRQTAVNSLAGYASQESKDALLGLFKGTIIDARVRSTIVSKLRTFEKEKVADILADAAANDASYETRVEAIDGLATLKATEQSDLIVNLVGFKSQHDQVRNAALRALADLDDERGMALAMQYAVYGFMDRARPTAIGCIGRLAKHDQDKAVSFLLNLLNDPEWRSVNAAGSALVEVGDRRAVGPIRAISETNRDPAMRNRAKEWLKSLEEKAGADAGADSPRGRRRGRNAA